MANYYCTVTDNGDGSWTLGRVQRAGSAPTGGTALTPERTSGDAVGTTTGWTYQGTVGQVAAWFGEVISADLSLNGY